METNIHSTTNLFLITNNYQYALNNVDIIFITVPSFVIPEIIDNLILSKKTIIVLVPGSGGKEFFFKKYVEQGHIVVGMDRVPFVSRILESGKSVLVSKKKKIRYSLLNCYEDSSITQLLNYYLNINVDSIPNYLNITLTPSNQILHSTRLYSLLANNSIYNSFDRMIKFYAEWDDTSSYYLLSADNELQEIAKAYKLKGVISLKIHYESNTINEITEKIKNIKSLSNIDAPLILRKNKYFVDIESRYFKEDFLYGLFIIKGFAIIANINTPTIDKILLWYNSFSNILYFDDNKFINDFSINLPLPQNNNLNNIEDVFNYYNFY